MTISAEPTINVPLLRKTLEHITAHPEEWDQESWAVERACGTSYCLAGTAAVLNGHQIDWEGLDDRLDLDEQILDVAHRLTNGMRIQDQAMRDLGLTFDQAHDLFHGGLTLPTLWAMASDYTNGAIEVPAELVK